jgi:uncharacterized protein YecE (DUF72 family)
MEKTFFIGCSGFSSRNWKDNFYAGIPASRWLAHYASVFNSVEINSSFYKLPTEKALEKWRDTAPEGFRFTLKAHRGITHFSSFNGANEQVAAFYNLAGKLKEKLGAILFQLPGSMHYDEALLQKITGSMSNEFSNAVEFRHSSWWNSNVFQAFREKSIIFCNVSLGKLPEEVVATSGISYSRLHGKPVLFKSSYSPEELKTWMANIKKEKFTTSYIYFNNTWFTAALENARFMQTIA